MRIILPLLAAGILAALLAANPVRQYTIETTRLVKNVWGYNGLTPVRITLVDGKITEIVPLKNDEDPAYFKMVLESGIFTKLNGKTPEEALKVRLDAVSGATYSSEGIIRNIRAGLKAAADSLAVNPR